MIIRDINRILFATQHQIDTHNPEPGIVIARVTISDPQPEVLEDNWKRNVVDIANMEGRELIRYLTGRDPTILLPTILDIENGYARFTIITDRLVLGDLFVYQDNEETIIKVELREYEVLQSLKQYRD